MGPDCGLRPCARCFEYHMDLAKESLNYETIEACDEGESNASNHRTM